MRTKNSVNSYKVVLLLIAWLTNTACSQNRQSISNLQTAVPTFASQLIQTATTSPIADVTGSEAARSTLILGDDVIAFILHNPDISTPNQDDIYLLDLATGNIMTPSNTPGLKVYPRWSPDGTQLVYSSGWQLFLIPADGSYPPHSINTALTGASQPDWSPDGKKIIFSRFAETNTTDLYVIDINGENLTRLTNTPHASETLPYWSPDGMHILYLKRDSGQKLISQPEIMVTDAGCIGQAETCDHSAKRLNSGLSATWSPDGSQIAYWAYVDPSSSSLHAEIYVMNTDGSDIRKITDTTDLTIGQPSWSPDGKRLVFFGIPLGEDFELYVVDIDGTNLHAITNDGNDEMSPAWRP